ncbi:cytochrome c, class I [gamma proteobacterium NOR5-3]|nr:cytochrome c, class I [gamma proteobacterium NOR5-3]
MKGLSGQFVKLMGLLTLSTITAVQVGHSENAEGDTIAYKDCLGCHGTFGQGNSAVNAPVLASMEAWSIRNQLQAFREGWRGTHALDLMGMAMAPSAKALKPSELPGVIKYIAALPPRTANLPDRSSPVNVQLGKTLYGPCAACHGPAADGDEEYQAPALAYQNDAYLIRQLKHFRDGVRGHHPDDRRGARMAAAAQNLDDGEIVEIVRYLRSRAP